MKHTKIMKEKYRERLKKIIGTKIQTTMIFPLSQIETAFGHLWGHGKDENALTNDEKVWRRKWNECRNNILNNGNQQKRNASVELDMYDVIWNGYQTTLIPMSRTEINKLIKEQQENE